jgi:uncharacterized membrane protein YqjE
MSVFTENNPLAAWRLLRSAGGALGAQMALHGQLAQLEWAIEKSRWVKIAIAAFVLISTVLCLLLLTGILALALAWQTPYRLHAVACVLGIYGLIAALSLRSLSVQFALGASAFKATREEVMADIDMLRARLSP